MADSGFLDFNVPDELFAPLSADCVCGSRIRLRPNQTTRCRACGRTWRMRIWMEPVSPEIPLDGVTEAPGQKQKTTAQTERPSWRWAHDR